jgi:hypothetical protein
MHSEPDAKRKYQEFVEATQNESVRITTFRNAITSQLPDVFKLVDERNEFLQRVKKQLTAIQSTLSSKTTNGEKMHFYIRCILDEVKLRVYQKSTTDITFVVRDDPLYVDMSVAKGKMADVGSDKEWAVSFEALAFFLGRCGVVEDGTKPLEFRVWLEAIDRPGQPVQVERFQGTTRPDRILSVDGNSLSVFMLKKTHSTSCVVRLGKGVTSSALTPLSSFQQTKVLFRLVIQLNVDTERWYSCMHKINVFDIPMLEFRSNTFVVGCKRSLTKRSSKNK